MATAFSLCVGCPLSAERTKQRTTTKPVNRVSKLNCRRHRCLSMAMAFFGAARECATERGRDREQQWQQAASRVATVERRKTGSLALRALVRIHNKRTARIERFAFAVVNHRHVSFILMSSECFLLCVVVAVKLLCIFVVYPF